MHRIGTLLPVPVAPTLSIYAASRIAIEQLLQRVVADVNCGHTQLGIMNNWLRMESKDIADVFQRHHLDCRTRIIVDVGLIGR